SVSSISPSAKSSSTTTNSHRSKLRSTSAKITPSSSDNKDAESSVGYNSEDEYERSANGSEYSEELERKFEEKLRKTKGYTIKKMKEDGACLFRSVADQIYGDQEMHGVVRKLCMDYMAKNADHFSAFVTEDFSTYIDRKRMESAHGNHAEIQALAEMFNRPIEVYRYSMDPINTFYTMNSSPRSEPSAPIRVTYHRNMHYNSLVDPYAATIGVGLGLPQFYPGMADKNLLNDVQRASEQDEIERAMLKDKLMATDWEATDEQIQEQIARESYLEWIRTQEKRMKENNRGESTVTRPHSKPKSPPQQTSQSSVSSSSGVISSNSTTRSSKASSSKNCRL
uniref:ubiquitinyl hydrolase 1 n=1 Tax=Romanomermis culicivorax TaxID=13658 RepID=A0A915K4L6_ROMCU